jgi:hypothetical protein
MLIKCAFVGQKKTLIFIEMHGTTTTKSTIVISRLQWNHKYQALLGDKQ